MEKFSFNISLNGRHLFRTDLYDSGDADAIQEQLVKRFPSSEGFRISRSAHPMYTTSTKIAN
jgi:hypothetical protein